MIQGVNKCIHGGVWMDVQGCLWMFIFTMFVKLYIISGSINTVMKICIL